MARLSQGRANTARGTGQFLLETISRVRYTGATDLSTTSLSIILLILLLRQSTSAEPRVTHHARAHSLRAFLRNCPSR